MTTTELIIWLADNFHDWNDGDDWVTQYEVTDPDAIFVEFASGVKFSITVEDI